MESKPLYSVIIPVYNVENNIKRCIESVLRQSFKNFELILVDDGSSDASGVICDTYAQDDERIVVVHQKNQGVSAARNTGVSMAAGEYIVFIDSDDFVEQDLLRYLHQSDADLVIVGFSDYLDNKVIKILVDENEEWKITSAKGIEKFIKNQSSVFVWGKRYKKSVIDKYNIKFRYDMTFNEDIIFNNDYILKTESVVNIKWAGYYHCQYMNMTLSSTAMQKSFIERTKWREIAYNQFKEYPSIREIYASQMLYFAEQEIFSISNKKESISVKCTKIEKIITDDFFRQCMAFLPQALTFDVRLFCRYKLVILLVIKYYYVRRVLR
ncbi:MAG: glycosyltransferase family 2 protein [Oliverpabstia sp.]